jgi:hypothetical protein
MNQVAKSRVLFAWLDARGYYVATYELLSEPFVRVLVKMTFYHKKRRRTHNAIYLYLDYFDTFVL